MTTHNKLISLWNEMRNASRLENVPSANHPHSIHKSAHIKHTKRTEAKDTLQERSGKTLEKIGLLLRGDPT